MNLILLLLLTCLLAAESAAYDAPSSGYEDRRSSTQAPSKPHSRLEVNNYEALRSSTYFLDMLTLL